MKKIPTIFVRDPKNMRTLLDKPHSDCAWVFNGGGVTTRKYDGTCCKVFNQKLWKRREVKRGRRTPAEFVEEQFDTNTGKRVGWVPVDCANTEDKYHRDAFEGQPNGTYELCGPKIQKNPDCPRDLEGLKDWLKGKDIEGIVFHHPDGRKAKIKKQDFNLRRTT